MASRIAVSSLRASGTPTSRVRPQAVSAVPRVLAARGMASASKPPPEERAAQIVNSLPSSPGLVTKTGSVILGTGLLATAISQELYVVNEESVIAAGFFILISFIYKAVKEPYRDWAEGHIKRVRDILNASRTEHTQVVKERIESVEQMKDVVAVTEGLFALSKETAQLESEAFVQRQKVALASEVKAVLDSWVRFEQQAKESEQADLVKSVVDNVLKSINNEKTQKDILAGAVAEIEQLIKNKAI
ncbi:ATP synthase [Lentinus brumalis]|uniref:ATP synthase subunit 4 n=1 Tax=Lentinus brumalis TaxID=2498619 RepID=A0A371DBC2_9APHY|nr:ATP synthase [Polyporus brumalis]